MASGAIATWIVWLRSAAEMPVVTPSRASIETVKAVPSGASLCSVIGRRPSLSARSSVRQRQIRPRACVAMKLIVSGVANCAAITRSPSFSRSGSSTTTTKRPSRISSIASSIVANGVVTAIATGYRRAEQPLDVLGEDVDLEVEQRRPARARRASSPPACAGSARRRSRARRARRRSGSPLERDRALFDDVAEELGRQRRPRCARRRPRAPRCATTVATPST